MLAIPAQESHDNHVRPVENSISARGDIRRITPIPELNRSRGRGLECAVKSSADPRQSPSAGSPARLNVTSFLNHE
jgi:hypothetical protein